jgi:magnesium-transporting ATPase (P-type)
MQTTPSKSAPEPAPSKQANDKPPDIASASVPDTLAALHVNPDTGLSHAEVDVRRKEHGYNEVAEKKGHSVLKFLRNSGGSRRGCSNWSWFCPLCSENIRTSSWWVRCWS